MENKTSLEHPSSRKYLPKHLGKDAVKWLMIPSKIVLDGVNVWPERQNFLTKIINFVMALSYVLCILGNCYYVSRKDVDLGSTAFALSLLILNIEVAVRIVLIHFSKKKLSLVLSKVYYQFWPSALAGNDVHTEIVRGSRFLFIYCAGYTSTSAFCATQFIIFPYQERNLPISAGFPFLWQESPYYEFMYVWQSFLIMVGVFIACGLDFFFLSLVYNCVAQFKILKVYLNIQFERAVRVDVAEAKKLLVLCIDHHNRLIRVCNEIAQVFTYLILMQYLIKVGSICLYSFTAIAVPEELGKAIALFMGHMSSIFIFCYIGNELVLESTELSSSLFQCGWHLSQTDKDIQKTLIMMMIRSQKPMSISAGGFGILSIETFIKLIQFAFSVFTFLRTLLKKQNSP